MPVLTWIRAHMVMLTSATGSVLGLILITAHAPDVWKAPIMALAVAILGLLGGIGLVARDRYVPLIMGVVKAAFYLLVLFNAPGLLADPAVQASALVAIETVLGLFLMNGLTANTPAVPDADPGPVVVPAHFDPPVS